jgi:hypothetical protein
LFVRALDDILEELVQGSACVGCLLLTMDSEIDWSPSLIEKLESIRDVVRKEVLELFTFHTV